MQAKVTVTFITRRVTYRACNLGAAGKRIKARGIADLPARLPYFMEAKRAPAEAKTSSAKRDFSEKDAKPSKPGLDDDDDRLDDAAAAKATGAADAKRDAPAETRAAGFRINWMNMSDACVPPRARRRRARANPRAPIPSIASLPFWPSR